MNKCLRCDNTALDYSPEAKIPWEDTEVEVQELYTCKSCDCMHYKENGKFCWQYNYNRDKYEFVAPKSDFDVVLEQAN